jgi:CO/xanthine dehydrogenase Mo-binding subunit
LRNFAYGMVGQDAVGSSRSNITRWGKHLSGKSSTGLDVGKAIHPSYVEGQIQGGVAQGIGWALNEEYIYDRNGRLDNAGFLDYRVPVASDMPMIEPILVEVPNPAHPYGAKGVGEVNIVPPMAAIANAIDSATHRRLTELPMSPPKVRAALDQGQADD